MAAVPGSIFRRTLFWAHLCCGVAAGLIILLLSVTGVLLAYEKQLIASAAQGNRLTAVPATAALGADRLAQIARDATPQSERLSLVFDADPLAPVTVSRGRDAALLLNPYTGALIPDASTGTRQFLHTVEDWHRWLAGDPRSTRANLVDVSNLLFVFLVLSGSYLWLPAVWRWRTLRGLLFFKGTYINSKLRDFTWHHVFGVWMLIPLFLISVSGVVISYEWASNLVYAAYGEQAPQRRGPEGMPGSGGSDTRASLDVLLATARGEIATWQRLTLPVLPAANRIDITAELKSDAARPPRQTLTLNAADGSVLKRSPPPGSAAAAQSPGQRARVWFRFVHTGEAYGLIGQTLAALASIAACFLVYTGLALAFRRLILPLWRSRSQRSTSLPT